MTPSTESAFVSGRKGGLIQTTFYRGDWQEAARNKFRNLGSLREDILAGGDGRLGRMINLESFAAKEFASNIVWSLGKGVDSIDCGVCTLVPEAVLGLGGAMATVKTRLRDEATGREVVVMDSVGLESQTISKTRETINAVFGLIDADGMISPLAFSICIMLIHAGKSGTMIMPYGPKTDFERLFKEVLVADSFF